MKKFFAAIMFLLLALPAFATVSTETTKVAYTCNGVITSYAYPFKVLADADLQVIVGTDTVLTLNSDYTVTGAGSSAGTVVLTAGSKCGSGSALTILRNIPATQLTDYVDGEAFSAESIENALDKVTMIQQQQKEAIDRSWKLPRSSSITALMPNPSANNYIGWNAAATGLENKPGQVITTATQYEVDALVSYGGGTAYTQSTISAALTAIGTINKATLLLRPGVWVISSNFDASAYTNVTFKVVPGAVISHGAFTVKFGGPVELSSGSLSGTGTIIFGPLSVPSINPEWYVGTDSQKVQYAVNSALANYVSGNSQSIPMKVARAYTITTPINIDRPVSTTFELFKIIGEGLDAGFITALNDGSSMFTSTLDAATPKTPVSEGVLFQGIKFASTTTGLSNFAIDGSKFLRMNFSDCYWDKIRLAYSNYYFQSWYLNHPTIERVTGIFMEVNPTGTSVAQGSFYDVHFKSIRNEGNATQTGLVKGTYFNGSSIMGGNYENTIGPLLDASCFGAVISGLWTEAATLPIIKLNGSNGVAIVGNLFSGGVGGQAIDHGTSANVTSSGNYGSGVNLHKIASMIPIGTGNIIEGIKGLTSLGDVVSSGKAVLDVVNTSLGENIAQQDILTGAYVDSSLVISNGGAILVTVSEPQTSDTVQSGKVVLISRVGTGTDVQVLGAGASSLTVTCSSTTGYKVRITNPTAGTLYAIASILRLR